MTDVPAPAEAPRGAERVNRRFAGVGAALGLIAWYNLFQIPGVAGLVVGSSHPRLGTFLALAALLLVVPGTWWVARSVWGRGWRRAFPLGSVGPGVLAWTVLGVLALLMVEFGWFATLDRLHGLPSLESPLPRVGLVGVVLGAPLAEEALFRGYGLARIRELGGERRALLLTAAAFALAHVHWVKLPGSFALGLLAGWLVLRTESLWPALLAHATVNALAAALTVLKPAALEGPAPWALILGVASLGGVGLAVLGSPWVRGRIRGLSGPP